ncbi:MAG TPA: hypothetical protein VFU90_04850 [Candidatus Tumulicola sp.]|nr:hypothetical protein [Candidatus Tumulicola sp.]
MTIRRGSSSQTLTARTTPDVAPGSRESVIAGLFRRLLNDLQDRMRPYMVI